MSEYPLESFVFYRSFRDAIAEMSDKDQLATLLAICDYALYGLEPQLESPMARAIFTVARPSIDANKGRRANGAKGGRPRKNTNGADEKNNGFEPENQWFSKAESTEAETVSETVTGTKATSGSRRFSPPSLEEVAEYVSKRGSHVDPQGFIDFYASKGWMVGKTPMKDWKAACRNAESWERWRKPAEQPKGRTGRIVTGPDGKERVVFDG